MSASANRRTIHKHERSFNRLTQAMAIEGYHAPPPVPAPRPQ